MSESTVDTRIDGQHNSQLLALNDIRCTHGGSTCGNPRFLHNSY